MPSGRSCEKPLNSFNGKRSARWPTYEVADEVGRKVKRLVGLDEREVLASMAATLQQDDRRKGLVHPNDNVENVDRLSDNFVSSMRSMSCIHKFSAARAVLINGVISMKEHWQKTRCPAGRTQALDDELANVPQTRWSPCCRCCRFRNRRSKSRPNEMGTL